MSRKAKEIKIVGTDSNGVAIQEIVVSSTVKGEKIKTPVKCPHFREADIDTQETSESAVCIALPENWTVDRFLKALNQGTRLLAQQPVHAKFTETGVKTKNRLLVQKFMWENTTDADVQALVAKNLKATDMNEINKNLDEFFEEFGPFDEEEV